MSVQSVCVCSVEQPFVRGGAEIQMESLAKELEVRGYRVARVTLPFVWTPVRDILRNCLMWRWIELDRCTNESVDLVVCSKFPTYAVKHPRKVTWLIHQFRQAYELFGTEHSQFGNSSEDTAVREAIVNFDKRMLSESRAIFTESQRVADRLKKYNGLTGRALYHPPQRWDEYHHREYGDYVLTVGRLVPLKRIDLLLRAVVLARGPVRVVIVGDGPERAALQSLAERLGIADRTVFTGALWGPELLDVYAGARAVYYAPYDEDYGLVVPEAFRSRKPVITTVDAGGTLEFVSHGANGWVTEPEPDAIGAAVASAMSSEEMCGRMGDAGHERVKSISWDHVIESLVSAA